MIVVSDEDDPLTVATPPAKKARTASRTSAAAAGRTFRCIKMMSDKTFDFLGHGALFVNGIKIPKCVPNGLVDSDLRFSTILLRI